MKVSEERLKELVGASGLEPCDFEPVWDSLMVGEVVTMARELLALRKAISETYGWIAEYPSPPIGSGGMSYEFHDNQMEAQMAANEYEGFAIEVCRKP